jgi:hypothetical protein
MAGEPCGDVRRQAQADRVVHEDGVAEAEQRLFIPVRGGGSAHLALLVDRTSSGSWPGGLWVAQLKQGSKARNAISMRFKMRVGSTPGRINDRAAFFVHRIGALLLVVPTMRLALVQIQFSSQV